MAPTAPDGGWTQAVRQRLGLGRLLPLGIAADGCWLAERAADGVLRRAGQDVAGVRLGTLRVGPADPDGARDSPGVPPPPGALPPGPLRVDAEFEASHREPIPYAANRLRAALFAACEDRLGLVVTEVDLRATGLLGESPADTPEKPEPAAPPEGHPGDDSPGRGPGAATPGTPGEGEDPGTPGRDGGPGTPGKGEGPGTPGRDAGPEDLAAHATLAVPGVARLTSVLGAPVHYDTARPGHHVRVEVAVTGERPAREVGLAVRAAVADALPGRPTVAVLITDVTYEK